MNHWHYYDLMIRQNLREQYAEADRARIAQKVRGRSSVSARHCISVIVHTVITVWVRLTDRLGWHQVDNSGKKIRSKGVKGPLLIIISAFFYASYGIWSKMMAEAFGEFNQAWFRGMILLAILIPFGIAAKKFKKIEREDWKWFIVTALAGGLNQAPYFFGYKYLPIGTATITFYTMLTIGIYLIGKFFFAERLTAVKWISLVSAILGMGFLYTFSLNKSDFLPFLLMGLAGFIGAAAIAFSKKISSKYGETQILTSYLISVVLINGIISIALRETVQPNVNAWLGGIGYVIAYLIANATAVAGFKYIQPSVGGLIGLVEIVFGIIFGVLFFQEVLTVQIVIGSCIIIGAITAIQTSRD
jgi:drug/metabolite transporter (DMT)-like permease